MSTKAPTFVDGFTPNATQLQTFQHNCDISWQMHEGCRYLFGQIATSRWL